MLTKHLTWVFPSGTELFICSECGAQIVFDDVNDREIDLLEPELQVKAREEYEEYNDMITTKVKTVVEADREDCKRRSK